MDEQRFDRLFPRAFEPGAVEPFLNLGEWAMHDVLPILCNKAGPMEVKVATFNVSEDGLRPLFFLCGQGGITRLSLLLDLNVRRHKLDMLLFAAHVTPHVRLAANHAKVLLARGGPTAFGIVGSQNMNRPRRAEAGFYFTAGPCFDFFDNAFDRLFDNAVAYGIDE